MPESQDKPLASGVPRLGTHRQDAPDEITVFTSGHGLRPGQGQGSGDADDGTDPTTDTSTDDRP
jgi:hypothetical protein